MHIIAGRLRSRSVHVPKGLNVRPTTGKVREAIFNMVESRCTLSGVSVLDLFAGTGLLGLEALSRGAQSVVFVEKHRHVLRVARQNAEHLEVHSQCQFRCLEVISYLTRYRGHSFDLVLADPPYDWKTVPAFVDKVMPHVAHQGIFVLEHDRRHSFKTHPLLETYKSYGRTQISIFRASK